MKHNVVGKMLRILYLTLFIGALAFSNTKSQELLDGDVVVDFSQYEGAPIVKKFDYMNSGIVGLDKYKRDLTLFNDLKM